MITLYQFEDHIPTQDTTNPWKEAKENIIGDKRNSRLDQQESIGSGHKTRQSHTIKLRITKIFERSTKVPWILGYTYLEWLRSS